MKVVIDIPSGDFNSIRNGALFYIQHDRLDEVVTYAFNNATIIPEGHGDLIDRDNLKFQLPTPIEDEYKTVYRIVNAAPAVIEADKENDDENNR